MSETPNQAPKTPYDEPRRPASLGQLKSAQTLVTVATIAGPVSLLIGGVVLSTVGLVCAILAVVKARRALTEGLEPGLKVYASRIQRSGILSVIICALALVLNAIALATVLPAMMQALQTGDLSSLYDAAGIQGQQPDATAPKDSIWG